MQTVGRCLTDCRHRCSPSQNLTSEKSMEILRREPRRPLTLQQHEDGLQRSLAALLTADAAKSGVATQGYQSQLQLVNF